MGCQCLQDMKAKHEKETNLKAERDLMAKEAADKEAAAQVKHCKTCLYSETARTLATQPAGSVHV